MSDQMQVMVRPYDARIDMPFIFHSWRCGLIYGAKDESKPRHGAKTHTDALKLTLSKASILVACDADERDHILGFSITTVDHLEWIYVKKPYRNQGIARLLFPPNISTVTKRLTKIGQALVEKKQLQVRKD